MRVDGECLREVPGCPGYYVTRSARIYSRRADNVSRVSGGRKWRARVRHDGREVRLGNFDSRDDAADAVMAWRVGIGEHPTLREIHPSPSADDKYLRVALRSGGEYRWFLLHRLVAMAFHANPERLPVVRHLDGDAGNNHADNLAWGTHGDNEDDKILLRIRRLPIEKVEAALAEMRASEDS